MCDRTFAQLGHVWLVWAHGINGTIGQKVNTYSLKKMYSSNKIRKTQNEHLNIVCQNLNSQ